MSVDPNDVLSPKELEEWAEAQEENIREFFEEDIGRKISNLKKLHEDGFINEAWTLAFCYVDGFAKWFYEDTRKGDGRKNGAEFAEILTGPGKLERALAVTTWKHFRNHLVHALGLVRAYITLRGKRLGDDAYFFPVGMKPPLEFDEFLKALQRIADEAKKKSLETKKWFGTID